MLNPTLHDPPAAGECRWTTEWTHEGVRVVDCAACGFKHQLPTPTEDEVSRLYGEEYYEELKPDYLETVQRDAEHVSMWAASKKSFCEGLLESNGAAQRAVLDVGASFGQFLRVFAQSGWRAVGVEPSRYAARVAAQNPALKIHNDLFERTANETLRPPFRVVHMAEVINHLRDPANVLRRIHDSLLAAGGILVVETSNDFNPLQWAVVDQYEDSPWWIVPDHVAYFDKDSLCSLLTRIGFEIAGVEATFPMELFPLLGWNYRQDPSVGKECHRRRVDFELNLHRTGHAETRRRLYTALADAGFGRSIIVYARKK